MERVCEELDEAKAEIEQLAADLKCKNELYNSLKRTHSDQLVQIRDASLKMEKQAQELNEKTEENCAMKQMCEDLQCSLKEKESIIRNLSTANDKLRVDCGEKDRKWEEEKRGLVLALDEANEKNIDHEQRINVLLAEIEGLKGLLSTSEKKCIEVEEKAKSYKELRERDDMLLKLEEESRKVEDQLKWKKEQFKHLEEAHQKLKDQFRESKKEWEMERATLVEEIFSLQTSLDSQTRISEDLQRRLMICNQSLAHEESQRKCLEFEVSEFKTRFENVFMDYQDAKSQLECMSNKRDEEIASLRHTLSTKEALYKEVDYRAGKLEQDNQELLSSLRELREAQIQELGNSSSLGKLRNKLKSVEHMHRDCSATLRAKEAEWSSRVEKLTCKLNDYQLALESKEAAVAKLKIELENCHSFIMQLKMQHEEASVMLLVLKSGITEAQLNLGNTEAEMILCDKERDENVSVLKKQLEKKNAALDKALIDLEKERNNAEALMRVESLDLIDEKRQGIQKELERYKEMLEESSRCQLSFKEQALQTEIYLREKVREVCDALDRANWELTRECEKVGSLLKRAECFDFIEEKWILMQTEFQRYQEMLEESSRCQLQLEEQALKIESDSKEKVREFCDALEMAISELDEHRKKMASLSRRVESLDVVEEQQHLMQKEIEGYKKMLEESNKRQLLLEEKYLTVEIDLTETLKEVSDALDTANSELLEEREKTTSLSRRVKSLDLIDEQQILAQKELERYKEMLEESLNSQSHLKQEALQKENDLQEKLWEAHDALDRRDSELADKILEDHAIEFELWIWSSIAERLKADLEESQKLREQLEASLLAQVEVEETITQEKVGLALMLEEKDRRINNLERKNGFLEKEAGTMMTSESEKAGFLQTMREMEMMLQYLQEEIGHLEQESLRRELEAAVFTQTAAERKFELEKGFLVKLGEEKDGRINELLHSVKDLEQKFNSSLLHFSSTLAEKQAEVSLVNEAREKIVAAGILAQLEIEENKLMSMELEDGICSIQLELETQQRTLSSSRRTALEAEAELGAKQLEMKELQNAMHEKLRTSESLVDELKNEKRNLVEDVMKLSSEKETLFGFLEGIEDRIGQLSSEDMELMGNLEKVVQSFDNDGSSGEKIEENKLMSMELEDGICSIQQELETQERTLSSSRRTALEAEAELGAKQLEMKELQNAMHEKLRTSESLVDELKNEKRNLVEDVMKLSSEKETLFGFLEGIEDRIGQLSSEDMELMGNLEKVVQSFDNDGSSGEKIEENKLMSMELEDGICSIQQELETQERTLSSSRRTALEAEAELGAKQLEMKELQNAMHEKLRTSESLVDELKNEKRNLVEDVMKLSSEKETLFGFLEGIEDRIGQLSSEDMELMGNLEKVVQSFDNDGSSGLILKKGGNGFLESVKENSNTISSPTTKRFQAVFYERSPFRQLN